MPNELYFNIKFYQHRPKIDISNELNLNEKIKAIDLSLDYVEILTYFITRTAVNKELDCDSRDIYFSKMNQLLGEFLSFARSGIEELEDRRLKLEV